MFDPEDLESIMTIRSSTDRLIEIVQQEGLRDSDDFLMGWVVRDLIRVVENIIEGLNVYFPEEAIESGLSEIENLNLLDISRDGGEIILDYVSQFQIAFDQFAKLAAISPINQISDHDFQEALKKIY